MPRKALKMTAGAFIVMAAGFLPAACAGQQQQPSRAMAIEAQVLALGTPNARSIQAKLQAFRQCVVSFAMRTPGSRMEPNLYAETAFAACATEEGALTSLAVTQGERAAINDYKQALKSDLLSRI